MRLSLVVAVAENGVIGRAGGMPWHLPEDLRRFKRLTTGHAVLMGRKTFASLGCPLPDRQNIVLSRDPSFAPAGIEVGRSLEDALARARGEEVFVIGGEALFREALPLASRIHLTLVHAVVDGDVRFPLDALAAWRLLSDKYHPADARHPFAFSFRLYESTAP
ncbi:MAG: dihydrofolate reductase [Planctomycetes bacterium]|nr:dihydrofolate reductase [Planctomycetota bacterium]